ncbi:MAG: hypothetical protein AAF628_38335 [Planctomycetota bacterium]
MMRSLLLVLLLCLPNVGCATILGTAVSPMTGGVDLVRQTQSSETWPLWLPVFIGGAVSGPFVAFFNGVNRDAEIFRSWGNYWSDFGDVFRPFEMIGVGSRRNRRR